MTEEKILEKVQLAFEKFKHKTYTIRQAGYTREITITICGYNETNKSLLLIGELDNKKGIDGFKSKSSFDFILNHNENERYVYISIERIEEAHESVILNKKNVKRILRKEVNNAN